MLDARRTLEEGGHSLATFVAERWRTLLVDFTVLAIWALALLWLVGLLNWPPRVFYAALVVGAVAYSLVADWWWVD